MECIRLGLLKPNYIYVKKVSELSTGKNTVNDFENDADIWFSLSVTLYHATDNCIGVAH